MESLGIFTSHEFEEYIKNGQTYDYSNGERAAGVEAGNPRDRWQLEIEQVRVRRMSGQSQPRTPRERLEDKVQTLMQNSPQGPRRY